MRAMRLVGVVLIFASWMGFHSSRAQAAVVWSTNGSSCVPVGSSTGVHVAAGAVTAGAGITVNGGDPTASDTLIVNGIPGATDDLIVNPTRLGRWHPRVIKRRIKPYDLMNRPRHEYAEPMEEQDVTT